MATVTGVEKVLPYDHSTARVAQERGWDCGPASVQIVLQALGIDMSEDQLIRELGTDTDGTDTVEQALPVLNRVTSGQYKAQWMPADPPTREQRDMLWRNVSGSIDAGFGCVLNFEVPSNNFPRGTRGSVSPAYRGARIYHYVACMGYADDGPGGRHFWIADPGFPPNGYWMSAEQAATAIPPHAYAFATARPAPPPPAPREVFPPPQASAPAEVSGRYASRSGYRTPGEGAVGDADWFVVSDDAMVHVLFVELSATQLGDVESIYRVARAATGRGADTSEAFMKRAQTVLGRIPKDALAVALAKIETTDPELFAALRGGAW